MRSPLVLFPLLAALAACSSANEQQVARGATTGVSAGMAWGPIGIAVGGLVGGLVGAAVPPPQPQVAALPAPPADPRVGREGW